MKSHYKRIGDYVTQIKLKNTDDSTSLLKGININKHFMPSVANINGTDLSKYRVVKKNQFAFNPMHVGRDEVLPISMLEDDVPIIVSPAYVVFEVKDEKYLLPEYLMMWCRRAEFDRNAWFLTDNSVRGGFSWADFCDMEFPVPSIEKQHEIVCEYNVVNDRIVLSEQLNQKLEDTAQAIYKQWFIDFEFPISKEYAESIGKPELEGKPYKFSGGEMEFCELLDKDIPLHWKSYKLDHFCDVTFSKRIYQSEYVPSGVPFFRSKEIILKRQDLQINSPLYISRKRFEEITSKFGKPSLGDILISAVGTIGVTYMVRDEEFYIKDGNMFWLRNFKDEDYSNYIYSWMQSEEFSSIIEEITYGSTQSVITTTDLCRQFLVQPEKVLMKKYFQFFSKINNKLVLNSSIKQQVYYLKGIILAKMSKA